MKARTLLSNDLDPAEFATDMRDALKPLSPEARRAAFHVIVSNLEEMKDKARRELKDKA